MEVPRALALRRIKNGPDELAAVFARDQTIRAVVMADRSMVCCMLMAIVLGPLGLWVMPNWRPDAGSACCPNNRRSNIAWIMILSGGLSLAAGLFILSQPSTFQHICRAFGPL